VLLEFPEALLECGDSAVTADVDGSNPKETNVPAFNASWLAFSVADVATGHFKNSGGTQDLNAYRSARRSPG
jgi:hypothetical protein